MFKNLFKPIMVTIPREEYDELVNDKLTHHVQLYCMDKELIANLYNQLQEKQEYCDYLELESNKTEKLLEASESDCEYANKVNLANVTFMQNVRAENDRLGKKLKNQNDLVKTLTADLKYKNEVIQSLESKLEKGFEATLSISEVLQELSKIGNCLPKPITTKGKDETGEYTDYTYTLAKICTKCNEQKPLDQFHKQKGKKGGVRSQCKECRSLENNVSNIKPKEFIAMETMSKYPKAEATTKNFAESMETLHKILTKKIK
jgi:hypothetical protein